MEAIDFFIENKTLFLIFHMLSVVVGMGSAIIADILFNFYNKDKIINNTERRSLELLSKTIWISLIVIILSGVAIFFSDPTKYMLSQKFITKMIIVIILLLNGLFLSRFISPHFSDKGMLKFKNKQSIRQFAFASGAISITSWFIVFILGTLKSIPFHVTQAILIYTIIMVFSVMVALFIEKKTFSK